MCDFPSRFLFEAFCFIFIGCGWGCGVVTEGGPPSLLPTSPQCLSQSSESVTSPKNQQRRESERVEVNKRFLYTGPEKIRGVGRPLEGGGYSGIG